MQLDEAEREIFDEICDNFAAKYGEDVAFAFYKLHREFANKLGHKHFPSREFHDQRLYRLLCSDKFNGISLHQIFQTLEKEIGIRERAFYNFYHHYFIPRRKEETKKARLLK